MDLDLDEMGFPNQVNIKEASTGNPVTDDSLDSVGLVFLNEVNPELTVQKNGETSVKQSHKLTSQ